MRLEDEFWRIRTDTGELADAERDALRASLDEKGMPDPEGYTPLSGLGPNGPYMMYWAWNVCTPVGESAEKFPIAQVGTTGPAEVAGEGMSG